MDNGISATLVGVLQGSISLDLGRLHIDISDYEQ